MARYALVTAEGVVENVVVWDGESDYESPDGLSLVEVPDGQLAEPGGSYDGSTFAHAEG